MIRNAAPHTSMGETPPPTRQEILARRAKKGEAMRMQMQLLEILTVLAVSALALMLVLYL